MKTLNHTQSATALVEDINANLREMSSAVEVTITDSATKLIGTLNSALDTKTLSLNDDADTFVEKLNTAFENAIIPDIDDGIATFDQAKYGEEMADTVSKAAVLNKSNLTLIISTDIHHEIPSFKDVTIDGTTYSVPLKNGYSVQHTDTFTPMMSNHKEFLRRCQANDINVNAIVCLGDVFDGHRSDYSVDGVMVMTAEDIVRAYIGGITDKYKALSSQFEKPLIFAVGNHDDNWDSNVGKDVEFSYQDLYDIYVKDTTGPVNKDTAQGGLNYYIDYEQQKIRIIVLFCQTSPKESGYTFPTDAYNYMVSSINGMSEGYKALILCHLALIYGHVASPIKTNDAMTFLSANSDKVIGYISGHGHYDASVGYPVTQLSLTCNKLKGSVVSDSWSIVSVNQSDETIRMIRFTLRTSEYKDRIIHYAPIDWAGNDVTLATSLQDTINWGIGSLGSWFVQTGSSTMSASYKKDEATDYVEITPNGASCSVHVKAQNSSHPECVNVYAENGDSFEFWTIKIPASS